jgi:hypothetical protein
MYITLYKMSESLDSFRVTNSSIGMSIYHEQYLNGIGFKSSIDTHRYTFYMLLYSNVWYFWIYNMELIWDLNQSYQHCGYEWELF